MFVTNNVTMGRKFADLALIQTVRAELLSQHWARAVTHKPAGSCNYQCLAEMDLEQNIAEM